MAVTGAALDRAHRLRRLRSAIRDELTDLDRIAVDSSRYATAFAEKLPDDLECRGLAALLHDFYTGLERIFQAIADEIDGGVPGTGQWHRLLLRQMALDVEQVRPAVLEKSIAVRVEDYLRFRHLFRNLYGHRLDWERMRPLLGELAAAHSAVRANLQRFEAFLDTVIVELEHTDQPEERE